MWSYLQQEEQREVIDSGWNRLETVAHDYYLRNTARLFTTRYLAEAHAGSEEHDNMLNKTPRNHDLFSWSIKIA
jgi:hypothetical protein